MKQWIGMAIAIASVTSAAVAGQRGTTVTSSEDAGRRLEHGSLLPSGGDGAGWRLGRIDGRLGQRIDSRLDLRLNGASQAQRNQQSQVILKKTAAAPN